MAGALSFAQPAGVPCLARQTLAGVAGLSYATSAHRQKPSSPRHRHAKVALFTIAASHAAEWTVPEAEDGWVLSHDALRLDLADLQRLLDALGNQGAAGRHIERWQLEAALGAWRYHAHMLAVHHDTEEGLYFPLLRKRFEVPAKQSADHQRIVELMRECDAKFEAAVRAPDAAAAAQELQSLQWLIVLDSFARLQTSFKRFRELCEQHYREEEVETLPLIRQHFAPTEVTPTAKRIARAYSLLDMGNYLRPMSRDKQVAWMSRVRMPFFVQWLMLLQVWRYNRAVVQPLQKAIQHSHGVVDS